MKVHLLAGVAYLSLAVSGLGALGMSSVAVAQEAAPAAQPGAQDCSGLGCIFGGGRRQQTAEEARALQDNQRAAEAEQGRDGARGSRRRTAKATSESASSDGSADDATKAKKRRAVHTVTIAADAPEVKKLQSLAAALPKEKIKIVKARDENDKAKSDFTVSTSLDAGGTAEKAKLFTEQLHIVAGGTIKSVADLNGQVVSFGPEKGPTQAAARKAFAALNVKVVETPLDIDNALDGLATGDIAAVVVLAPQPLERLKSVKAEGLHLVSWPEGGTMPNGANVATIDSSAYPSLAKPGETIRAVGVDATLTLSAKGAKQGAAKSFLKSLSQNADALTKRGFDLLKADLQDRQGRRLASADRS